MTVPLRADLEPLPRRMRTLPIDARGYVVPWFVAWVNGEPEFRALDPEKWLAAVRLRLCWVCGQSLGTHLAFPIGPMCAVSRTTSEPPAHRECAEWSIRHCPFLSNPDMARRTADLPTDVEAPAGFAIQRNPGVICLWMTRSYEVFNDGRGKPLITIGAPTDITWWARGRAATRADVEASIESGLPILLAAARSDGPFAVAQLGRQVDQARQYYPAAETPVALPAGDLP